MLITIGTLVVGLAVLAVAFEAPFVALGAGGLAYWMFALAVH
jgi:hypothetical protein